MHVRGSYATKVLNTGLEIKNISAQLGHKNIETTENYYISTTEDSRRKTVNIVDKLINDEVINDIISYKIVDANMKNKETEKLKKL